jgi:hypothetical protein
MFSKNIGKEGKGKTKYETDSQHNKVAATVYNESLCEKCLGEFSVGTASGHISIAYCVC